jgi:hypothetical protein
MAFNYSFLHQHHHQQHHQHQHQHQHQLQQNTHIPMSRSSRRSPSHFSSSSRGVGSMKELTMSASVATFRAKFEAGRSFDLDDDLEFCPELLTDEEIQSISSASSDQSSNASSSPHSSPLQHQIQPSSFSLNPYGQYTPNQYAYVKVQNSPPTTARARNAIPIVNPSTGMRVASPPLASPSRQPHSSPVTRRMW